MFDSKDLQSSAWLAWTLQRHRLAPRLVLMLKQTQPSGRRELAGLGADQIELRGPQGFVLGLAA
jgi:hypothetical protein